MVKSCVSPNPENTATARVEDARIHFKNTYEVATTIKGWKVSKALKYLDDVLEHKRCVPFRRYRLKAGRTPQAKEFKTNQGRWPEKSVKAVQALLRNAQSNAELKELNADGLFISHIMCNCARQQRRRTYRAHGRINPFMSSPTHMEVILTAKPEQVKEA
eukprot:NODE_7405_length_592_cov_107.453763_g7382_i0.p1 GENE.NODE_7405_length_592_cov_107.453763_g7382_i0~~NODE_7405_length_592_cov_107.453763_g7382_i0.p1  ORF type:complete len:160 (+),score=43.26 NODE_7405_length_592_cov_107.453763_g7382_i0:62-541(+)